MNIASIKEADLLKIFAEQKSVVVMEDGSTKIIDGITGVCDGRITLTIPKNAVGEKVSHIDIMPDLMTASTGDDGYIVTIGGIHEGNFITYFKEREDIRYITNFNMIPVFGIKKENDCLFAIATGMAVDMKTVAGVKNGTYYIHPRVCLEGDESYEDIVVEYVILPGAGYSEMAAYYRNYQLERGACVPLRERAAANAVLKYAAESVEIRIRQAWKPAPSPVLHQTPDTQPPLYVACDFKKVEDIIGELKRQGLEKAEICLVGWNAGGHGGRFPQLFPVEEKLGGEAELRKLIKVAGEAGYNIVCHTNNTDAFECAEGWDPDTLILDKEGTARTGMNDCGGIKHFICPPVAHDKYAVYDLPRLAGMGFSGLHFIDIFTADPARKCYNEKHKINRKQAVAYFSKMASIAKKNMGGFASEGPYDFICGDIDYVLYITIRGKTRLESKPLFDEVIPFWQLVYHGIILSNPDSATVNYTTKGPYEKLKLIETGGRPIMYFYSRFGEKMNWMGDIDLAFETGEELTRCVRYIKQAYDEYKDLIYLQYEFMDKHEKVAEGVYRTTYSDRTTITVDYNTGSYDVDTSKK